MAPDPSLGNWYRRAEQSQRRSDERRVPSDHPWPYLADLPMVLLIVALILLVEICAARASASPYLSLVKAGQAVEAYEGSYWHRPVTLQSCRRHSSVQAICTIELSGAHSRSLITDWATLLPHGIVRVHPGSFVTEIRMDQ